MDPGHYQGWSGDLAGCEFDAHDMVAIAESIGFEERTALLTADATVENVTAALSAAASKLASGDILFLTYSGHGGSLPDKNGDEPDQRDETWVLYDRQFVDDELFSLYVRFKAGVRILVLSDSCHSGTEREAAPQLPEPGRTRSAVRHERTRRHRATGADDPPRGSPTGGGGERSRLRRGPTVDTGK